ncbi:hypothetical protein BDR07DRAFT_1412246 [Suillus spraguei]|nr:hypothetical protein BDR07DRAFT_1412246 [Suillus spraguei]
MTDFMTITSSYSRSTCISVITATLTTRLIISRQYPQQYSPNIDRFCPACEQAGHR